MNLPARFSEQAFRRYEPDIQRIVDAYPEPTVLTPRLGLSQETVAQRLRDAMRSLSDIRWTTTINMEKFTEVYAQIQIVQRGEDLIAQRKSKPMQAATLPKLLHIIKEPELRHKVVLCEMVADRILPSLEFPCDEMTGKLRLPEHFHSRDLGFHYENGFLRVIK